MAGASPTAPTRRARTLWAAGASTFAATIMLVVGLFQFVEGLVAVVNDHEQLVALGPETRKRLRYVLLSHDNDGVTKFGPDLLNRRPAWLGPDRPRREDVPLRSPRGIPKGMRWRPVTTFFQTLIDMKNAQVPGSFRAWAHDYRADLPEFIRDVYDLECTDEQMQAIQDAVRVREELREGVFA